MIAQKSKASREKLGIKPLEISYKGDSPAQANRKVQVASSTPQVYYYGAEIVAAHIKQLTVDSNKFLPLCFVNFIDLYGMMNDIGFPTDNAKLLIVLPSNHANLGNIFMEFKITKFEVITNRGGSKQIMLWGICNLDSMLVPKFEWREGTSYQTLEWIAQDSGLGFSSNVSSSMDKQKWLNPGMNRLDWCQNITHSAWNGESSYIWSFVDFYYNLNYVDVEGELTSDISQPSWLQQTLFNGTINQSDSQKPSYSPPFLTNNDSMKTTNQYFTSDKILNKSTSTSLKRGYIRSLYYYDIDGNWDKKAGQLAKYDIDTITTPGSESTSILLKGDPGSTQFYKMNHQQYWLGTIDTSNSHPDTLYAKLQNSENMEDLQKIMMQIELPIANFNIKRFEKIRLLFTNRGISPGRTVRNAKLNGEWLVVGITYNWSKNSMSQKVNLVKRELTIDDLA